MRTDHPHFHNSQPQVHPFWLPAQGLPPSCAHLGLSHLMLASLLVHWDLKAQKESDTQRS